MPKTTVIRISSPKIGHKKIFTVEDKRYIFYFLEGKPRIKEENNVGSKTKRGKSLAKNY